jgi:primosomal protein N' (replication factor Y)
MELMYIVNVIPLIKIPYPNSQVLSYFSDIKIKPGVKIKISVRNKKIDALVYESKSLEQERLRLKKYADFEIKPIEKITSKESILNEKQLELLRWLSDYYFASIGLFARIFISKKLPVYTRTSLVLTPKTKGLVFSPFKRLKSIIIEDADNDLYESWGRKPYYNVKNIAIQLAQIHDAKLILKSNLPSVETCYWAKQKKYKLLTENCKLKIENSVIDMRKEMISGNFSIISNDLLRRLEKSDKSILFIARRGTSTIVLCRECGYIAKCHTCETPMVYHEDKPSRRLVCHHCGKDDIAPVLCPNCKSVKIKYLGAGTQKVESEIKKLLPNKTVFRLDGDISEKPKEQQKIINEFNSSKEAVLVGSQMILNKGLKADIAAIVSIDTILNLPDFKTSEKIFETINQLMGMVEPAASTKCKQAGPPNCEAIGGFLIQTYNPDNQAIGLAIENDFNTFYNGEIEARKKYGYPPFSEIIKLSYSHRDFVKAKNEAKILFEKLKVQISSIRCDILNFKLLGPAPAFVSKDKGTYRWNIIIKSRLDTEERNRILIIIPPTWEININPENTL